MPRSVYKLFTGTGHEDFTRVERKVNDYLRRLGNDETVKAIQTSIYRTPGERDVADPSESVLVAVWSEIADPAP